MVMEQIVLQGIIFCVGIVFGVGSFYGLVTSKFNGQNDFNKKVDEQLKELSNKIDGIKDDILELTERVSRIEGKINGKVV
ncbi:MAG: hypothetical protein QXN68_00720 [Thermoplasmata archaeon]